MGLVITSATDNGNGTASVTITSSGLSNTCYISPDDGNPPVWTQFGLVSISGAGTFGPVAVAPGDYLVYVHMTANSLPPFTDIDSDPVQLNMGLTSPAPGALVEVETDDAAVWDVEIDDSSCSCERPPSMAYNFHELGQLVRVSATFREIASGDEVDPDVVLLAIENSEGAVVEHTYLDGAFVVRDGTGAYHADVDASSAGTWFYRWRSTGDGQAARETRFKVRVAQAVA